MVKTKEKVSVTGLSKCHRVQLSFIIVINRMEVRENISRSFTILPETCN